MLSLLALLSITFITIINQTKNRAGKGKGTMEFVTVKELSQFLKVKESTLYSWVHSSLIPYHKLNGLVRFDMEEIREWVRESKPIRHSIPEFFGERKNLDIERIIKKAIDSVRGKEYNPSNGKPGQIKVSGRSENGTV